MKVNLSKGVDSFTCLIPKEIVKSYSYLLDTKILTISEETGEVLKEEFGAPIWSDVKGIRTRLALITMFGKMYFKITLTSKMLKERYFEGININNINLILDYLDRIGLEIDRKQFLSEAKCFDVDYFIDSDYHLKESTYQGYMKDLIKMGAKGYFRKTKSVLEKKTIAGCQFINRKDASIKMPFIKVYDKEDELMTKSFEFFHNFLEGQDFRGRRRLEVTVKNKKHFQSIFGQSVEDKVINVNFILTRDVNKILGNLFSRYDAHKVFKKGYERDSKKYSPTDKMMGLLAYELMLQGYSFRMVVNLYNANGKYGNIEKSRMKTKVKRGLEYARLVNKVNDLKLTARDAFIQKRI